MDNSGDSCSNISDVDMVLLSFANWLTELRNISQASSRTVTAEMSMVSNKVSLSQSDLKDFKQQSAVCQQQMQHNIAEIKDILTRTCGFLSQTDKDRCELEQKLTSNFQGLRQILSHKQSEIETLQKNYIDSINELKRRISSLEQEVHTTKHELEAARQRNNLMQVEHARNFKQLDDSITLLKDEYTHSQGIHKQRLETLQKDTARVWSDIGNVTTVINKWQTTVDSRHLLLQRNYWDLEHKFKSSALGANFSNTHVSTHPTNSSPPPPAIVSNTSNVNRINDQQNGVIAYQIPTGNVMLDQQQQHVMMLNQNNFVSNSQQQQQQQSQQNQQQMYSVNSNGLGVNNGSVQPQVASNNVVLNSNNQPPQQQQQNAYNMHQNNAANGFNPVIMMIGAEEQNPVAN
eukprot:GDKK01016318.1.p1 GENE.GDKK01016318.1~~GDKK01016318.1.p1  ORF type:complete len:403 (-),score=112.55 GDKK01016318.1:472-1680(-)